MYQLKKQKLNASDESTEELLLKMALLSGSLSQWKCQAKELTMCARSMVQWLEKMRPAARFARKGGPAGASDAVALVSLRKHQQMLKEQRRGPGDEEDSDRPPY